MYRFELEKSLTNLNPILKLCSTSLKTNNIWLFDSQMQIFYKKNVATFPHTIKHRWTKHTEQYVFSFATQIDKYHFL